MYRNKTKIGRTVSPSASFEDEDELKKQQTKQNSRHEQQNNSSNNTKQYGLSTKVALGRLHDEIEKMLEVYELKWNKER